MAQREKDGPQGRFKARVQFAGLDPKESPPSTAMYELDATGRAVRKLAEVRDGQIEVQPDWEKLPGIALGPDTDDVQALTAESLVAYRLDTIAPVWRDRGILIGRDLWHRFLFEIVCVAGQARKCRPWWWRHLEVLEASAGVHLARGAALRPAIERPDLSVIFPIACLPLCDGIVEIYERVCCCRRIVIPDLLIRLRDILRVIPIPLPDPPIPIPDPGPDPPPFERFRAADGPAGGQGRGGNVPQRAGVSLRREASELRGRSGRMPLDPATTPSERLFEDYVALSRLRPEQAQEYALARPYLLVLICSCTQRKVGEVPLQPGGRFDFCYLTPRGVLIRGLTCHRTFAYKVRQRIHGEWVTVYDGVAAHDWFAEGTQADLRTWDWRALPCGSGPGDPPPGGEGLPFVLLEYVTGTGTRHHNFPAQNGLSQLAALNANSGTYTTGYAPDCPWGGTLGLRLWVHPDMQPIARYYRFSVVPVGDNGQPSGGVTILDAPVSWSRFVLVGADWVVVSELLSENPANVGGQQGLIKIPYWSGGNFWLSGQYHQLWNTPTASDGRHLLVIELFDAGGARIKPSSAPAGNPGVARPFQFRRWRFNNTSATDNVPFADAAHAFWVDNLDVNGDIVDIRRDHVANTAECQFISGSGDGTIPVSIGFRAYHERGVLDPTNTFMRRYSLTWTRGLNGPSGSFGSGTSDVGEPPGGPAESNSLTIAQLLGPWPGFPTSHQKCTFSVHLHVEAKHFTGGSRILAYDYHETASFALSID